MALTVNNVGTLSLLNVLNRTSKAQSNVLGQMATGYKINRGADDPAGLLAVTSIDSELTSVNAGIASNQRTDAILGVADGALGQIASTISDIQRLANESASSQAPTLMFVQGSRRSLSEMPRLASFGKWLLLICISPMS